MSDTIMPDLIRHPITEYFKGREFQTQSLDLAQWMIATGSSPAPPKDMTKKHPIPRLFVYFRSLERSGIHHSTFDIRQSTFQKFNNCGRFDKFSCQTMFQMIRPL